MTQQAQQTAQQVKHELKEKLEARFNFLSIFDHLLSKVDLDPHDTDQLKAEVCLGSKQELLPSRQPENKAYYIPGMYSAQDYFWMEALKEVVESFKLKIKETQESLWVIYTCPLNDQRNPTLKDLDVYDPYDLFTDEQFMY